MAKQPLTKPLVENRRARHEYSVDETIEAGLVLEGWEVKSLLAHRCHFTNAYAKINGNSVVLVGMTIEPLPTCRVQDVRPDRPRQLLLHRHEISRLVGRVERAGMTLIPLRIYTTHRRLKLALGVARGKQDPDKRRALKDRAVARDQAREGVRSK